MDRRDTQIMSIFGAGDWRSDFFSEFLPVFTTWQSEHGMSAIKRLSNRLT